MSLHTAEDIIEAMKALPADERYRLCNLLRFRIPGVTDEYMMMRIACWEEEQARFRRMINEHMELGRTRQRKPSKRHQERDAEILRLHAEGKSLGTIHMLVKQRWPKMENKKPLTEGAVKAVLTRARLGNYSAT